MKKRIFLIITILVLLIVCFTVSAEEKDYNDIFRSWGEYLNGQSSSIEIAETDSDIYAKGKDVCITNQEMEQTILFYELQGIESDKTEEVAYAYMKESAALYAKAISEGYSVTDEEVETYVDELRKIVESENLDEYSKQQIKAVIDGFGDEEAYWEYEKIVYQKLLVSQKYVDDLQKDFYSIETNTNDMWEEYYTQLKTELVEEQQFEKMK